MSLFAVILLIVFLATWAMMVAEGIWSNLIALVQIVLSGLIAFGLYQPLTVMLDERTDGEYTYALDIVVIWGVYALSMIILRVLCELLSKTRLVFPGPADKIGGPIIAVIAGFFMSGFAGATLHTAPLPRDGLGGGMDYTRPGDASMLATDAQWLRLVETATSTGLAGPAEFSAEEFLAIYGDRRERYVEQEGELRVDRK